MEFGRGGTARRALIPIVVLALTTAACAAPVGESPAPSSSTTTMVAAAAVADPELAPLEPFTPPDITTRRITITDLEAMLPPGGLTTVARSNEDLVTMASLDREDEAADVLTHGRQTGIGGSYTDPAGAHVWIDVLVDADAAGAYLLDAAGDIAKGIGGTHAPNRGIAGAREFPVDVGEQSIGIIGGLADGSGSETMILARVGRIVFFVSFVDGPEIDGRVRVQYLAEDVLDGIIDILTERGVDPTSVDAPRYRFETTMTVTDEGGTTEISAIGLVDGSDRSCTITVSGPDVDSAHRVVSHEGLLWWKSGESPFSRVTTGNLTVAGLLAACPSWPLTVDTAGLGSIVDERDDPARHHVNGVDALGYQADHDALAAVLGLPALASTVDGFSFWIADGTPWVVEVSISLTGPASERSLLTGSLAETIGPGTTSVRHRVFEIGTVADSVVPPA